MYKFIIAVLTAILITFGMGCGGNGEKETPTSKTPWIGTWQMVGYDNVSVANRDTFVLMNIDENKNFRYTTKTTNGEILMESEGRYSINDQQSLITITENGQSQTEYFIRKVDKDSFIFQSDTFSIKWKRIE
jgi:uncharacterized protein YegP (UPF0339 family)